MGLLQSEFLVNRAQQKLTEITYDALMFRKENGGLPDGFLPDATYLMSTIELYLGDDDSSIFDLDIVNQAVTGTSGHDLLAYRPFLNTFPTETHGDCCFSPIGENEYGTHPAFFDAHSLYIWLLQNGGLTGNILFINDGRYYTKSQTYTRQEVQNLFTEFLNTLPAAQPMVVNFSDTVNYTGGFAPLIRTFDAEKKCFNLYTRTLADLPSPVGGVYITPESDEDHAYYYAVCCCAGESVVTPPTPTLLGLNISHTDVTVFGGSDGTVTVTGTGGSGSYQYSPNLTNWTSAKTGSHTFLGQTAGRKTFYVRNAADNADMVQKSVEIKQPNAPAPAPLPLGITAVGRNVTTYGGSNGSITATASDGTPPYQFSLDDLTYQSSGIFSGLTKGNYAVWVKDSKGDIATTSVAITEPAPAILRITATSTNVTTYGGANGSVTASASGGVGPYQYRIGTGAYQSSPSFSGLAAGTYTVWVKDSLNATESTTVTITQPNPPVVPPALAISASGTNVSVYGGSNGSLTATATGGVSPYQFSIDNNNFQGSGTFSGLSAGSYTVWVRDTAGTKVFTSVTITQPAPSQLTLTATTTNVTTYGGTNGSITASASGGIAPYVYRLNNGNTQSSPTFNGLAAGNYTVGVVDSAGTSVSINKTITQPAQDIPAKISYYGWKATNTPLTEAEILAGYAVAITPGADMTADYRANTAPMWLWQAEQVSEPVKTKWFGADDNNGDIGGEENFFRDYVIVGNWRYTMSNWASQQNSTTIQFLKA